MPRKNFIQQLETYQLKQLITMFQHPFAYDTLFIKIWSFPPLLHLVYSSMFSSAAGTCWSQCYLLLPKSSTWQWLIYSHQVSIQVKGSRKMATVVLIRWPAVHHKKSHTILLYKAQSMIIIVTTSNTIFNLQYDCTML